MPRAPAPPPGQPSAPRRGPAPHPSRSRRAPPTRTYAPADRARRAAVRAATGGRDSRVRFLRGWRGSKARRVVADEVMGAIGELSGQEYVHLYASDVKTRLAAGEGGLAEPFVFVVRSGGLRGGGRQRVPHGHRAGADPPVREVGGDRRRG